MTQTKTKKALLMSVLSMVLCVAMLVGMTFAWFTDTASTAVNKIQAGNLEISLVDGEGNDLTDEKIQWTAKGTDGKQHPVENPLWEPGCTFRTEQFYLRNDGNLALKYKINLSFTGDTKLLEVLEFSALVSTPNVPGGMITLKTLDAINSFDGHLLPASESVGGTIPEKVAFKITAKMNKDAGNEYQGLELGDIKVNVVATQLNHESDSTGPNYDEDAPLNFVSVGTTEELKAVFANAKAGEDVNVSLTDDVTISDQTLMVANENTPNIGNINIQGNGNTITNSNAGARCIQLANFDSTRTITISDVKIVSESTATDNTERRGLQLFTVKNAKINLINCEIEMKSNNYSYPIKIGGESENLIVNITGCTLTGANCIDSYGKNCTVNITDCVLNSNFVGTSQHLGNCINDQNGTSNTYNIKNTTFNGNWAQPWGSKRAGITFNNLGGNVNNTGNQQFAME